MAIAPLAITSLSSNALVLGAGETTETVVYSAVGFRMQTVGDVDGDGAPEVLVGFARFDYSWPSDDTSQNQVHWAFVSSINFAVQPMVQLAWNSGSSGAGRALHSSIGHERLLSSIYRRAVTSWSPSGRSLWMAFPVYQALELPSIQLHSKPRNSFDASKCSWLCLALPCS